MATAPAPIGRPRTPASHTLRRRPDRGAIGGVCAGLADYFDTTPLPVRIVTTIVVALGGIGIVLYALAWALIPVAPESHGRPRRPESWREAGLIVAAVVVAAAAARAAGVQVENAFVWPFVLGGCGLALFWRPLVAPGDGASAEGQPVRDVLRRVRRVDAPRLVLGSVLVAFAVASLLHWLHVLPHSLGKALGAVAIVAAILALLVLPWFVRLVRSLSFERAARIREQERAELAAHLHDSVLQTLALIQRRSDDPREVAGLARRQERELRSWLQQRDPARAADSVASALERAAAEVEEVHGVPIEVVTVGDADLDARLEAIVQAAREAMTNAAKFAGCERVDLYAEVASGRVEVFVRDRGVGFDLEAVPADRRGLRESIIGRMERHRGTAAVRSRPGEGTEIELIMEGAAP
jgi:signal transduction histidine kinase